MNQVDNGRSCMKVLCKYGGTNPCVLPQLAEHLPLASCSCVMSAHYTLKFLSVLRVCSPSRSFVYFFSSYVYSLHCGGSSSRADEGEKKKNIGSVIRPFCEASDGCSLKCMYMIMLLLLALLPSSGLGL